MDILWNSLFFIIALGILVTIHEYGHFWVARKLGVKVLVFSFGFGKPLLQKVGKDGVRYYLSAFPLGGYVKMLDERDTENPVAEKDKNRAFNRQPVWARMAIVLAGPAANFILALFLYSGMYLMGIQGISTEIGEVPEGSIAEQAGLQKGDFIRSVDGQSVLVLHDVTKSIAKRMGEKGQIQLSVQTMQDASSKQISLNLTNWILDDERPELLHSLGIYHPLEQRAVEIASVAEGKPAADAGLRAGDIIKVIEKQQISRWNDIRLKLAEIGIGEFIIEVDRDGELIPFSVVITSADRNDKERGTIGIKGVLPDYSKYLLVQQYGLIDSIGLAYHETLNMVALSAGLFVKLIKGDISTKSLSGPISIAKGAGSTASMGLATFIGFLAMISVNLGFINLLPIPMLDGGHFLYFAIEAIKGSPLSEKVQEIGLQVGMMLVFALMAIAVFNDFARV